MDWFEREGMKVKFKKWISATAATLLLATSLISAIPVAQADEVSTRTIAEESIYDLLVDRFFNGSGTNDFDTNTQDPSKFAGGDFTGLQDKLNFIGEMGYTIVSIGPIFLRRNMMVQCQQATRQSNDILELRKNFKVL